MQIIDPYAPRKSKGKKWIQRLVFLAVAGAAVAVWTHRSGLSYRYHRWKQQRALRQAQAFIAKGDAPNAEIALRVAIAAVPGNVETLREAAQMLEQANAPQSIRLRRAVVQLAPDSAEDQAAFVLCCIKFGDLNSARDALGGIPARIAATPVALNAALAFAISTGDRLMEDLIYTQLRKTAPASRSLRIAQDKLRLQLPEGPDREAAKRDLMKIAQEEPRLAALVAREFAGDAIQRRDYGAARRWLAQVLADPSATLEDHLQEANLELLIDRKPFATVFPPLADLAAQHPEKVALFTRWLIIQNRAAEAEHWIATLPSDVRTRADVRYTEAECLAQMKDWNRLMTLVESGAWGPLSSKVAKLVEAAKTIDQSGRPSLRRETWDLVLEAANGDLPSLRIVQHLATIWGWEDESERALWSIVRSFPDMTWASQLLFDGYSRKKDAAGMRDVMATLHNQDTSVARYTNDWAILTMLTEPSNGWDAPKESMRRLYLAAPANPTYATGYAFALAESGKVREAVAIVGNLAPAERDYPPRQPYLGYIYGAARRPVDLARAERIAAGWDYLPEERFLFTRAREQLDAHSPALSPASPKPVNLLAAPLSLPPAR